MTQHKELPVLPNPVAYIASDKYGNCGIAFKENIAMRSCEPGEGVIEPLVLLSLVQAYGAACAAHAREMALEEAKLIARNTCDEKTTPFADGFNRAALNIELEIHALKGK